MDINTNFRNGYKTRADASTRMSYEQISYVSAEESKYRGYQMMRLANGIVLDKEKTFGVLKFSALRHEMRVENEDGTTSEEIKRRTYDLKCSQQERTIQVSIPAEILVKDYPYNAEVELINPVADTVANANYRGADVEWYIKADDIVLKNKGGQPAGNPQGQPKK